MYSKIEFQGVCRRRSSRSLLASSFHKKNLHFLFPWQKCQSRQNLRFSPLWSNIRLISELSWWKCEARKEEKWKGRFFVCACSHYYCNVRTKLLSSKGHFGGGIYLCHTTSEKYPKKHLTDNKRKSSGDTHTHTQNWDQNLHTNT